MTKCYYPDLKVLAVDLPEDIEKKKWSGDFEGAIDLIEQWLKKDIPDILQSKLHAEKEILSILPVEYSMNEQEALAAMQEKIPDFTSEEFHKLKNQGKIDWICVNGEERYFDDFVATLVDVNHEIRARAAKIDSSLLKPDEEKALLKETIREIKTKRSLSYYFRLKASVRIKDDIFRSGKVCVHLPVPCRSKQVKQMELIEVSSEPEP